MKTFLKELTKTGGNMVMFGRSLQVRNPELHQWVIDSTPFLPDDCTFNERVYCILNDLMDRPRCPLSGVELRFKNFFAGYRNVSQKALAASPEGSTGLTGKDIETLRQNANEHFCRSMRVSNPELYKRILHETRDLGTNRMSERVYCILNGIKERPPGKFVSLEAGYKNGRGRRRGIVQDEYARNAALVGSDDPAIGMKITRYLRQNKARNAGLYELPDDEEGKSFVVCPILGTRMLNIKRPYVEGVLQMSWEEFLRRYPDVQLTCSGHSEKIGKGLQEEVAAGITKHAISVKKSMKAKRVVGEDGLTINQRKGRKTRETHLTKVDENGLDGYQRLAKYRNETVLANGLTIQQNALRKRLSRVGSDESHWRKASKASKRVLQPILDFLDEVGLKYYFDSSELILNVDGYVFLYDLIIPELQVCAEYQSYAYHPDPNMEDEEWGRWRPARPKNSRITADEKYAYDLNKARILFRERKYYTWFIWEKSAADNVAVLLHYLKDVCGKQ